VTDGARPGARAPARAGLLPACALVAATVLAYLPAFFGGFIWNDPDYVTAPALRSLDGLARIWTEVGAVQQYYPLLHSFFWVEHRLFGDAPFPYHAVTVALHAAGAVLFAGVLRRILDGREPSPRGGTPYLPGAEWLAAALFALHPVHVESVAWVTEQKNTLSLVLYLAAAGAYLDFDRSRRGRPYGWACAFFVLSLLAKTVTATLPAALLVVVWWQRGRIAWKRDVVPLLPWFAVGAALGLFASWVETTYVGARGAPFAVAPLVRVLVSARAVWFYLGSLLWPFGLTFIYPRWTVDPSDPRQWAGLAALAGALAVLFVVRRRARGPLAAALFFVGTLFPALGIVTLYGARYSWVWDHWQYLPDLGPLALAGGALVLAWSRLPAAVRARGRWPLAVLPGFLGVLTFLHCGLFRDNDTLYSGTLRRNPGAWMAHNNLGLEWSRLPGRLDEAIAQYREAIRINGEVAEIHTNLGAALLREEGRRDEALAEIREALRLDPRYPDAHFYLGSALAEEGRVPEAIGELEAALKADPGLAEASNDLGILLCRTGRPAEGLARIEAALRLQPEFVAAHFSRGIALMQTGRRQEAIAEWETTLALRPHYPPAERMLALARGATP
jgi:tetratricopeptide (TPR) repeat protein